MQQIAGDGYFVDRLFFVCYNLITANNKRL